MNSWKTMPSEFNLRGYDFRQVTCHLIKVRKESGSVSGLARKALLIFIIRRSAVKAALRCRQSGYWILAFVYAAALEENPSHRRRVENTRVRRRRREKSHSEVVHSSQFARRCCFSISDPVSHVTQASVRKYWSIFLRKNLLVYFGVFPW